MTIRLFSQTDLDAVARLCATLWPDGPFAEHRRELEEILEDEAPGPYPYRVFVADHAGVVVAFLLAGMRSHADGCDPAKPVGYIEGWFVDPAWRKQGVGRELVNAAESWARSEGCAEMASDTWLDNVESQRAHAALGYREVDRCVNYRKSLHE
jgi:aminoglycoside 6'-N-acetyltransferase I